MTATVICVGGETGPAPAPLSVQSWQKLEQHKQVRLRLPSLRLLYSVVSSERRGSLCLRERKELNLVLLMLLEHYFQHFFQICGLLSHTDISWWFVFLCGGFFLFVCLFVLTRLIYLVNVGLVQEGEIPFFFFFLPTRWVNSLLHIHLLLPTPILPLPNLQKQVFEHIMHTVISPGKYLHCTLLLGAVLLTSWD